MSVSIDSFHGSKYVDLYIRARVQLFPSESTTVTWCLESKILT